MNKFLRFVTEHAAVLVASAIAVVVLILVIIVFTLASSGDTDRTVVIEDIIGNAFILKNDGQISADKNMKLVSGDVIITAKDSYVRLAADKGKYIYIEPETTLDVYFTDKSDKGSIVVNLSEGAAVCRIDNTLKNSEAFEVRTPNTIISASGTVYRTEFNYLDNYAGYSSVRLTDTQCLEGSVNIQLYDVFSQPVDSLMLLAEGKSARMMTAENMSRYEFLNSDTYVSSFDKPSLEILIKIAAERQIFFSLSELSIAYQGMLETGVTEPVISTMYPVAEETSVQTQPPVTTQQPTETTVPVTAEQEETSACETVAISIAETTTVASLTVSDTAITTSETTIPPIENAQTTTTTTTATAATTVPTALDPSDISVTSPTTVIYTVSPSQTVQTTKPTQTRPTQTTTTTEAPQTRPSIQTSVPWWEIINSAALTSEETTAASTGASASTVTS